MWVVSEPDAERGVAVRTERNECVTRCAVATVHTSSGVLIPRATTNAEVATSYTSWHACRMDAANPLPLPAPR